MLRSGSSPATPRAARVSGWVLLCLLPACAAALESRLREESAGYMSCPAAAIEIRDAKQGIVSTETWTAVCKGSAFSCTTTPGGLYSTRETKCVPTAASAPEPAAPAPRP